jgi:SAM-dependent methyltransferase
MLSRLVAAVGPDPADIVELGCAPGIVLERLHRLHPQHRLHGIDFAPDGCRLARERFRAAGFPVTLHEGDLRSIELPRRYDLVLSCGLIEHFADPVEILRCHLRFAVPGGLVAVTVPNFATPVVRFFLQRFHPEALDTHNLAIMSETALMAALQAAGLHQVVVGSTGGPQVVTDISRRGLLGRTYCGAGQLWNFLAALLPVGFWQSHLWGLGRVVGAEGPSGRERAVAGSKEEGACTAPGVNGCST